MQEYHRIKLLGQGAFGTAYLCKHTADGKQYVVKEIETTKMGKAERDAAEQEAQLLMALDHPNIVRCSACFVSPAKVCIVLDYCSEGDLHNLLARRRGAQLPEDTVLDWFVQLCLGLKHVHDRKILHRDLKTQNVFVSAGGLLKLGDFGVSKVLSSTGALASTAVGTPYYLSPEICQNRRYNQKSDIWSLGCILHELATLKHAFEAPNLRALISKIIRGSFTPLPLTRSKELRDLVASMLHLDASRRPSVNQLLATPVLKQRIAHFLSSSLQRHEFSHTVIHGRPSKGALLVAAPAPPADAGRTAPPAAADQPAAPAPRPQAAAAAAAPAADGGAVASRDAASTAARPPRAPPAATLPPAASEDASSCVAPRVKSPSPGAASGGATPTGQPVVTTPATPAPVAQANGRQGGPSASRPSSQPSSTPTSRQPSPRASATEDAPARAARRPSPPPAPRDQQQKREQQRAAGALQHQHQHQHQHQQAEVRQQQSIHDLKQEHQRKLKQQVQAASAHNAGAAEARAAIRAQQVAPAAAAAVPHSRQAAAAAPALLSPAAGFKMGPAASPCAVADSRPAWVPPDGSPPPPPAAAAAAAATGASLAEPRTARASRPSSDGSVPELTPEQRRQVWEETRAAAARNRQQVQRDAGTLGAATDAPEAASPSLPAEQSKSHHQHHHHQQQQQQQQQRVQSSSHERDWADPAAGPRGGTSGASAPGTSAVPALTEPAAAAAQCKGELTAEVRRQVWEEMRAAAQRNKQQLLEDFAIRSAAPTKPPAVGGPRLRHGDAAAQPPPASSAGGTINAITSAPAAACSPASRPSSAAAAAAAESGLAAPTAAAAPLGFGTTSAQHSRPALAAAAPAGAAAAPPSPLPSPPPPPPPAPHPLAAAAAAAAAQPLTTPPPALPAPLLPADPWERRRQRLEADRQQREDELRAFQRQHWREVKAAAARNRQQVLQEISQQRPHLVQPPLDAAPFAAAPAAALAGAVCPAAVEQEQLAEITLAPLASGIGALAGGVDEGGAAVAADAAPEGDGDASAVEFAAMVLDMQQLYNSSAGLEEAAALVGGSAALPCSCSSGPELQGCDVAGAHGLVGEGGTAQDPTDHTPAGAQVADLQEHMRALRQLLEKELGVETLGRTYARLEALSAESEDDSARAGEELVQLLGEGRVSYLQLVHQLIICEEALRAAQA